MSKIALYFLNSPSFGLVAIESTSALSGTTRSSRGLNYIPGVTTACYKWGPGLRAFCLLVVKAYRESLASKKEGRALNGVSISGEGGSMAAALDGSISKSALWISECFGTDSHGDPILRRLITRTNPERKRPGAVGVGISASILNDLELAIFLNGSLANEEGLLSSLEELLISEGQQRVSILTPNKPAIIRNTVDFEPLQFVNCFASHTIRSLLATNIFDSEVIKVRYKNILKSQEFKCLAGNIEKLSAHIANSFDSSERLGLLTESTDFRQVYPKDSPRLKILLPGSHLPVVALLDFMATQKGHPFDLDYRFSHANEIVNLMLSGQELDGVDACVVSLGQLAKIFSSHKPLKYELLMVMPAVELSILKSVNIGKRAKVGTVHLLQEGGSSSSIFMKEVQKQSIIKKDTLRFEHCEPQSFANFLGKDCEEDSVVAWFPYSVMLPKITGCSVQSFGELGFKDNFLLLSKRLMKEVKIARALNISIRDSWLQMLENKRTCTETIERLLSTPSYTGALRRWIGWDLHTNKIAD
jgi:hypothetical protein